MLSCLLQCILGGFRIVSFGKLHVQEGLYVRRVEIIGILTKLSLRYHEFRMIPLAGLIVRILTKYLFSFLS